MNSFYVNNRKPLPETAFCFLPLGSVKPAGWLKKQLRIQADGQSGHLPEFWESLGPNSGWLGGTGESWERGPYYLDGLVPLAYLLEDEKLIKEAQKWIEWAINSQDVYGHFGPKTSEPDWWPFAIILKVLTQYHEVTGDERVISLMEKFFKYMRNQMPTYHWHSWGKVRWADMVLSIIWLYNRNGDPELIELAKEVMYQGYDWTWHFIDFGHTEKQTKRFRMRTHVVNNAMAIKTPAIQWELTGWKEHKEGTNIAISMLDEYHGTAVGIFTGDEHYAGKNPIQGTELCAVVEYMFSLENTIQILGDVAHADRLERIAYNALPGTFDEKMWAHQYDQQANQVMCIDDIHVWTNNRYDSNVFGLEPQYGCCTANFHQGWPKFAANLWMATPDDGLAMVAYGPCTVKARVRGNVEISIDVETDYPFDDTIKMTVHTPRPVTFPLTYRVPCWAVNASAKLNGGECTCELESGTWKTVEREWNDGDTLELTFPAKFEIERRWRDSVAIKRGPLVYSLKIGERWEVIREHPVCPDYAVYPTTAWNYGLILDLENPESSIEMKRNKVSDSNWAQDKAPIELKVKGRKIPEWQLENNCAGELPQSPVKSNEPIEELTLIPYGCAKLRITEFPLLED